MGKPCNRNAQKGLSLLSAMPRFFFHTEDGIKTPDEDGTELPDVEAAKRAATQLLADSLRNNSQLFWETENYRIVVADDDGLTLFTLELAAIIAPALASKAKNKRA